MKFFSVFLFLYSIVLQADLSPKSHFNLFREGYFSCYEGRLKQPAWVCEILTDESVDGPWKREGCRFKEDLDLPFCVRSTLKDYQKSGYDRGHLAPAADHRNNRKSMEDTFLLSNVSPQNPHFNRGYWAKLEKYVRELVDRYGKVTVVTGPLFLPEYREDGRRFVSYEVVGENNVAVPTHYFKLIQTENFEEAYIFPNKRLNSKKPLKHFQATKEKIEKLSGVYFKF